MGGVTNSKGKCKKRKQAALWRKVVGVKVYVD